MSKDIIDPLATATACAAAGDLDGAERAVREALARDRRDVRALVVLSTVLRVGRRLDEAVAAARKATVMDSGDVSAHVALGEALRMQDRPFEAVTALQRAVAVAPGDAPARHALGLALVDIGQAPVAIEHLRTAVRLDPAVARYRHNLATSLSLQGEFAAALDLFDALLAERPGDDAVTFDRSFCLLGLGRLDEGWAGYEHGFAKGARRPYRRPPVPRWDGQAPSGEQRVLVWGEQGIGDELRFASCAPDALATGAPLIIETRPRLVSLLQRSFPDALVRTATADDAGNETQPADYVAHAPLGGLPGLFRRSPAQFAAVQPYLRADPLRRRQMRERLATLAPGPRVGVCWRSMRLAVKRLGGYTTLGDWSDVLTLPGITFVSLQYGDPAQVSDEIAQAEASTGATLSRWEDLDYTNDFEAVAALTAELDLVVSVNTAVSALAGGLGKRVLQLGVVGDPFQFGDDSRYPWFADVTPFNRRWQDGWDGPMTRVAREVAVLR